MRNGRKVKIVKNKQKKLRAREATPLNGELCCPLKWVRRLILLLYTSG